MMVLKESEAPTLFKILNNEQTVIFTLHHSDGASVEVILTGNGLYCKDIRDKIISDHDWSQGNLTREIIK